ncbi:Lipoprotein signal peptidase [Clostridiaceae bacterium JG1575]|nr:Lipoprotein signal peptidase [Clostridiaceae bacterium JG1575]
MHYILLLLGVVVDHLTKKWAINTLSHGATKDLIPGILDFSYLENRGAAFGIMQNQQALLIAISALVVAVLLVYLWKNKESALSKSAMCLVVAGALGNLKDRITLGYVVDFIHFHLGNQWHFPTFNVADVCVTVGVLLLIIDFLIHEERRYSKRVVRTHKGIKEESVREQEEQQEKANS